MSKLDTTHNPYVPGEVPTDWSVSFTPNDWGVNVNLKHKVNGEWVEASMVDLGAADGFERTFRLYGRPCYTERVRKDPDAKAVLATMRDTEKAKAESEGYGNKLVYQLQHPEQWPERDCRPGTIYVNDARSLNDKRLELARKAVIMSDTELDQILSYLRSKGK